MSEMPIPALNLSKNDTTDAKWNSNVKIYAFTEDSLLLLF